MTQALQLLTIVDVGFGLAWYGLIKDRKEHKLQSKTDPSQ